MICTPKALSELPAIACTVAQPGAFHAQHDAGTWWNLDDPRIILVVGIDQATCAIEDTDLRVAWQAFEVATGGDEERRPELFGALEGFLKRFPAKSPALDPIVWPWVRIGRPSSASSKAWRAAST